MQKRGKLFIIAAPSGTGKSTIVNYLMSQGLNMHFSISLTTRAPRGKEQNGVEYFFTSVEELLLWNIEVTSRQSDSKRSERNL